VVAALIVGVSPVLVPSAEAEVSERPEWLILGYLASDGQDLGGGKWRYATNSGAIAERVTRSVAAAGLSATYSVSATGRHVFNFSRVPWRLKSGTLPREVRESKDHEAVANFFTAVIEGEGSRDGLVWDSPYSELVRQSRDELNEHFGFGAWVEGTSFFRVRVPESAFTTIQSWPFVAWGRVPGGKPTTTTTTTPTAPTTTTTVPPTTTTTLPPVPSVKPLLRGVVDRQGFAVAEDLPVVNVSVLKVDWAVLQPVQGPVDTSVIDAAVAEARRLGVGLKLRVAAGDGAPEWAKRIDGGPVTLFEPQGGTYVTVPKFWSPLFGAAYDVLMGELAARFESEPVLADVAISRCTTAYAEPFLRQASQSENRVALLAAGYTTEADKRCHREQVVSHGRLWVRTRSSMAFSPVFQTVNPDGSFVADAAFPVEMMDFMRAALGERAVLGNNSLSESRIGSADYGGLYAAMVERGGPLYWQTAAVVRLGDWRFVLGWAADHGANYVELPAGYQNWPLNELAVFDAAFEAN
jgi:hypothetical protein